MDPLVAKFADYGIFAICAFIAIKWLVVRLDHQAKLQEARTQAMMDRCDSERTFLVARIQQVEDRQHNSLTDILQQAAEALATNAKAFAKLTDTETDKFHAIQGYSPTLEKAVHKKKTEH